MISEQDRFPKVLAERIMKRFLVGLISLVIVLSMLVWAKFRTPATTVSDGVSSRGNAETTGAEELKTEEESGTAKPTAEENPTVSVKPTGSEEPSGGTEPTSAVTPGEAPEPTGAGKAENKTEQPTGGAEPTTPAGDDRGTGKTEPTPTPEGGTVIEEPVEEKPQLCISEILPTNTKYSKHNGGYYDAIEIHNVSEEAVMLSGYCLSDSKKRLTEYPLPEVELPAGGYAVFYCTGEYEAANEYDLRFKLSYFGEKVFLADGEGNILDQVKYPEMPRNVSFARDGETWRVCDKPTVGTANEGGYERIATTPEVDLDPGFYEGTQMVMFTTAGTIRYTLNGSKPDSSSKKWDGQPIEISSTTTIRAYATEENCLASFDAAFYYVIDAPDYELDVLMLSMKQSDFDTMNNHYSSDRKYAANITLFSNGREEFSEDCAISMFGATSRAYPKKSYQITFSTEFGVSKLQYRVFDDLDIDEFNSLVLRCGSQDASNAMIRDEYVSSLAVSGDIVDDVLVQAYKPVNLYVNGQYWGIYYIREHIDADMVASHYCCDPEEVTIIKQMRKVVCGKDSKEWLDLWKFISSNQVKDAEAYEYVKSVVDIQSVADYYIIQLWNGNIDMDNVRVCKAGGKWIYILYDLDLALCRVPGGTTANQLGKFNPGNYTFNALIYRLLENEEFRELFLERMSLLISTVFSTDAALTHLDKMEAMLDHDMVYNCERWRKVKDPQGKVGYRSYKGWKGSVEALRRQVNGRDWKIIRDFVKTKNIPMELAKKYFPMLY